MKSTSSEKFLASTPGRNSIRNEAQRVALKRSENRIPFVHDAMANIRATIMIDHLQCQSVRFICVFKIFYWLGNFVGHSSTYGYRYWFLQPNESKTADEIKSQIHRALEKAGYNMENAVVTHAISDQDPSIQKAVNKLYPVGKCCYF